MNIIKNDIIMKNIIRVIKERSYINSKLVSRNIKPIRVTVLPTGLVCEEYLNGTIKVI